MTETPHQRRFLAALPALLVLMTSLASGATMAGVFSAVQNGAKLEMQLSDVQLSLVQGLAFAIPMALLSVPLGLLVDRTNRTRLMIVLSLVWTLGTFLTAYATDLKMLFAARMLAGLGVNASIATAISLAADMCQAQQRGRAMLVLTVGRWVGSGAAFVLGGVLLQLYSAQGLFGLADWRSVHLALGIASALLTLPLLLLREPARQETEAGPHAPFAVVLRELWHRRAFVIPLFAGQIAVVMADAAATIWAAPVLTRGFGLQPQAFGAWLGLIILSSGIGGSILGGLGADWGHKTGRRGGILLVAVIAAGVAAPAALYPVMPGVPLFAASLAAMLVGGTMTGLATSAAIAVLLPNELRGLCMGLFIALAGVIGFGLAPTAVSWLSLALGGEGELPTALAILGVAVSSVSFVAFLLAMRNAPQLPDQPVR